jgi:hypothetical protein
MKKKVLCVLFGVLCTAALFAADRIYTSEGPYIVSMQPPINGPGGFGQAGAEAVKKRMQGNTRWLTQISKGQWEAVKYCLDRYETRKGDIFIMMFHKETIPMPTSIPGYVFICEFTSATQYNWWCFYGMFNNRTESFE